MPFRLNSSSRTVGSTRQNGMLVRSPACPNKRVTSVFARRPRRNRAGDRDGLRAGVGDTARAPRPAAPVRGAVKIYFTLPAGVNRFICVASSVNPLSRRERVNRWCQANATDYENTLGPMRTGASALPWRRLPWSRIPRLRPRAYPTVTFSRHQSTL